MSKYHVSLTRVMDDSYDIEIGRDLFDTLLHDLKNGLLENVSKFAVITDTKVQEYYGDPFIRKLSSSGFICDLFAVPAGEKSKNRASKAWLEDQLLSKAYGRDSCIIALGGGMVSDLAGFIASTFCRGIPYLTYSTTLLSAADASVGGKTAVNTPVATNLIGTFYQPRKVYIDLNTWTSLPIREFRSGLAETIKHACMQDYEFFVYLEQNMNRILTADRLILDASVCEHLALKNCEIKYGVVEKDEKESNLRQILNLGHTAGRAIETLSNYELLHGEAIAIGLVIQARLANKLGYLHEQEVNRITQLLALAGFNLNIPHSITPKELIDKMYTDKKVRSGKIRFVFQSGIGKVKQFDDGSFSVPVEEQIIYEILDEMIRMS
ncbi:MAG: 3-dehydroquinate synthase [Bacilli bacterium]|nr:3-dehydroquinate synthase [Bacilli bacterium]